MKSLFHFFRSHDDDTSADTIRSFFLAESEQSAQQVAERLATFIRGAQRSLDIATYNFRLSDTLKVTGQAKRRSSGRPPRVQGTAYCHHTHFHAPCLVAGSVTYSLWLTSSSHTRSRSPRSHTPSLGNHFAL